MSMSMSMSMAMPMAATSQAILPSIMILMVALAHAHAQAHEYADAYVDHAREPAHSQPRANVEQVRSHPHAHHDYEHAYAYADHAREPARSLHEQARSHPHAHHDHEHAYAYVDHPRTPARSLHEQARSHPHAHHHHEYAYAYADHAREPAHSRPNAHVEHARALHEQARSHPHAHHDHEHRHHDHEHTHAHHDHEFSHRRHGPGSQTCASPDQGSGHDHEDAHDHSQTHAHHDHELAHRRHGPGSQTCASPDQGSGHGPEPGPWKDAHATFYGSPDGTIGGACGYEESDKQIYGSETAALSSALFEDGMTCGACFEIKCGEASEFCKPGQPSVHITATDFCPPGGEGWCDSPKEHFDLSQPAFHKIAEHKGGIIPIKYRRVPCKRHGGIRFKVTGNPYFNMIGITNVGGAGDIEKVEVKVEEQWKELKHNYGDKWDTNEHLVGKKLTFKITTGDGKSVVTEQAAPQDWQFGQTYQGKNLA